MPTSSKRDVIDRFLPGPLRPQQKDVLKNISMVGNDLLVIGGGSCGEAGQSKPVGFGNPTLKVDRITVGGKKA